MNNLLEAEQPLVYKTIVNMCERGQTPHALIFYGDKSTSKMKMAKFLTKYLYSKALNIAIDDPIMSKRIDDNSHTNVIVVDPEGSLIRKSQIESIIMEASKSSLEDGPKVFIFNNADKLNQSSANSLLKFIEEPLDDVYIIFLVDNLETMLKTIKSRCALLMFKPLNKKVVKEKLQDQFVENETLLNVLSEYTQNIDDIISIKDNKEMVRIVDLVSELFSEEFEGKGSMVLYLKDSSVELDKIDKQSFFLSVYTYYLFDIMNYLILGTSDFIFSDQENRIKELSTMTSVDKLTFLIKEALEIEKRLKSNINIRANLDLLLLDTELNIKRA